VTVQQRLTRWSTGSAVVGSPVPEHRWLELDLPQPLDKPAAAWSGFGFSLGGAVQVPGWAGIAPPPKPAPPAAPLPAARPRRLRRVPTANIVHVGRRPEPVARSEPERRSAPVPKIRARRFSRGWLYAAAALAMMGLYTASQWNRTAVSAPIEWNSRIG
jgi:hypothetical protein